MDKVKQTEILFDKYASKYQDKYMDIGLYQNSFDQFISQIDNDQANVLDLACGPGNITQYLLSQQINYQILGLDISTNMINLARKNNPKAKFKQMDCRELDTLNNKFDAIMCAFCLPYFSKIETKKLLSDTHNLLINQGVIYISVMESDYNKSGWQGPSSGGPDKLYIYYHEAKYLCDHLENLGFEIIKLLRLDNPLQNDLSIKDLIIIAKIHNEDLTN